MDKKRDLVAIDILKIIDMSSVLLSISRIRMGTILSVLSIEKICRERFVAYHQFKSMTPWYKQSLWNEV